jgi:hypothetical protein
VLDYLIVLACLSYLYIEKMKTMGSFYFHWPLSFLGCLAFFVVAFSRLGPCFVGVVVDAP